MNHLIRTGAVAMALLGLPGLAEAHTGVHPLLADGFAAGFLHPFTGLDHLLAMVAVGLWAASLGGPARWTVPAAFLAVMTLSAWSGAQGVALPAVESMIAASVVVLGVLVALSIRVPGAAAAALVALFGAFHGHAHGTEMPEMAMPLAYGLGFVVATAMLHGIGVGLGLTLPRLLNPHLVRAAGGAIAAAGLLLVLPL